MTDQEWRRSVRGPAVELYEDASVERGVLGAGVVVEGVGRTGNGQPIDRASAGDKGSVGGARVWFEVDGGVENVRVGVVGAVEYDVLHFQESHVHRHPFSVKPGGTRE